MTEPKRRIAILVELPKGEQDTVAFRRMIKAFIRCFGLRCVGLREPKDTVTFKDEASEKE